MSTIKTKISEDKTLEFLKNSFDPNVQSINFLNGGEMSQAFSFLSKDRHLVIRFYKESMSFKKDKYAYDHFNSATVPIPQTIELGRVDDTLSFSITTMIKGKILDEWDTQTRHALLPLEIDVLDSLHHSKVEDDKYGWWDDEGHAAYASWQENLYAKKEHVDGDFFKTNKQHVREKEDIEIVFKKMTELIPKMPNLHYLIHADYGGNNLMSDGKKITGVLDFGNSSYGDFLYDVAWLDFWWNELDYKKEFYNYYAKKGVDLTDFEERILCYQLHMGLGILGFFIMSDQKDKYDYANKRIFGLF